MSLLNLVCSYALEEKLSINKKITLLLIEGNQQDRERYRSYFETMPRFDFKLIETPSGEEGLALCEAQKPDLVVLDYNLPDFNGLEFLAHLDQDLKQSLLIIMITGQGSETVAVEAMRTGACDYLDKNRLSPEALLLAIERAFNKLELRRELKLEQEKLLASEESYRSLSELSSAVLHNVGNMLNSLQTSCYQLKNRLETSKTHNMGKVRSLIENHSNSITHFFTTNPKGKLLPEYIVKTALALESERANNLQEVLALEKRLKIVNDIIQTQQEAVKKGNLERLDLALIVKEAVKIKDETIKRYNIKINLDLIENAWVLVNRSQLIHIVLNLLKNGLESIDLANGPQKVLTIEMGLLPDQVFLRFIDSGMGVSPEHLDNLFTIGFTTKKDGHGFGLHYCLKTIRSMDGDITCDSPGLNQGASFTLRLPLADPKPQKETF